MKPVNLLLSQLKEAPWNANEMDENMLVRLRESIKHYGIVENLVVRPTRPDVYEVLSGNQRLKILRGAGFSRAPCVIVDLDEANARLLAQALNNIRGKDNLGLRAELLRKVLETITESEILTLLPETSNSLKALVSMETETIAENLQKWQQARTARLRHLQFQVTTAQFDVIEQTMSDLMPRASKLRGESPNTRGTALYLLCKYYLEKENVK